LTSCKHIDYIDLFLLYKKNKSIFFREEKMLKGVKNNNIKYKMENVKKNYSKNEMIEKIYTLNLWDILKYQKIDAEFAGFYILNKDFQLTKEEKEITIQDVLKYQPHIKKNELLKYYLFDLHPSKKYLFDFEKISCEKT